MNYSYSEKFSTSFTSDSSVEDKFKAGLKAFPAAFMTDYATDSIIEECQTWVEQLAKKNIKTLIVIGMGGSSLGGMALQQYMPTLSDPEKSKENEVIFLEGPHPTALHAALAKVEESAILWVSKSGTTLEGLSDICALLENSKFSPEFAVITSMPERVEQLLPVKLKGCQMFDIPQNLGGRFSIVSAVGIIPGLFLGLDMTAFMAGFKISLEKYSPKQTLTKNAAKTIASHYYDNLQTKSGVVFWVYCKEMLGWANWLQQLWAESLGKKPDVTALPYVCKGPEDQHSILQFFQQGPNDYLHSFVTSASYQDFDISLSDTIKGLHNNHKLSEILNAQMRSIQLALDECDRPVSQFTLSSLDNDSKPNNHELGLFMGLWMHVVSYLGYLYQVNPFDQPAVEMGKDYCKKILSGEDKTIIVHSLDL